MEFPIFLLLLLGFSFIAGITEYNAGISIGYAEKRAAAPQVLMIFLFGVLNVLWSYFYFPLLIYYILQYLIKLLNRAGGRKQGESALFLLNLGYVNFIVLHLISVGITALARGIAMQALLEEPMWRMFTVFVCTGITIVENTMVSRCKTFSDALNAESGSKEGRFSMIFLWFCIVYLLMDSLLCTGGSELFYTPLFLAGSCAMVMSFLFLYLWHIYSILQRNYLREEQEKLESELETYDKNAKTFRLMTEKDAMTGACSRQYGLEYLDKILKGKDAISVAFLDLDYLKLINDQQGHEAGDWYLIGFVKAVKSFLKEGELITRMGGDEFMLLLPGSSPESAGRRLEELRTSLEEKEGQSYFFSFGIAHRAFGEAYPLKSLIQEADEKMYEDKYRRH